MTKPRQCQGPSCGVPTRALTWHRGVWLCDRCILRVLRDEADIAAEQLAEERKVS